MCNIQEIILNRKIIFIILRIVLYLGFYFSIQSALDYYPVVPALLTILLILLFNRRIQQFLEKSIGQKLYPATFKAEKAITEFNDRINGIVDFRKLLHEFYIVFDKILKDPVWAFYVLEKETFLLMKTGSIEKSVKLPNELKLKKNNNIEPFYNLNENDASLLLSNSSKIEKLLSAQLDTVIPIEGKNQTIALLVINRDNIQIFQDSSLKLLAIRVLQKSGIFLENSSLYLDLIHRNLEIKKLFEVSEKLLASFDTNEILDFILKSLNEVIPYDAAAIFLLDDEETSLITKASIGYGAKTSELGLKIGEGACSWVARNKKMSLLDNVNEAENYYPLRRQTQSQIALPLLIHEEILGVICLEKNELAYFTSNLIDLFNIFANQAAIALHNAKQYEISVAKRSLEHELINAQSVQQVLLPKRAPHYNELDIAFINKQSKLVGGDLFDFIPIDDSNLGVMIGDVAGKGAGAAIMMSLLLAGFRAYKKTQFTVCETVARLNILLEESLCASRYSTFFYGMISLEENKITFTNAGHNPPILVRKNGSVEELFGGGIVLGYLADETYIQEEISFNRGDVFVLYTDGITETMNRKSEEFGEQRLLKVIKDNASNNSHEIKEKIMRELKNFSGFKDPDDDATLIVIKFI